MVDTIVHIISYYVNFVDAVDYCDSVTTGNIGLRISKKVIIIRNLIVFRQLMMSSQIK